MGHALAVEPVGVEMDFPLGEALKAGGGEEVSPPAGPDNRLAGFAAFPKDVIGASGDSEPCESFGVMVLPSLGAGIGTLWEGRWLFSLCYQIN